MSSLVGKRQIGTAVLEEMLEKGFTGLYIGGEWMDASDGATIDVRNPATDEVIASVASASVADGLDAVSAAYDAADDWAATPPRERGEILRRAFELMIERSEEIAELMVRENGKTLADARGETKYAAEFFRWFSEEAVRNRGTVSEAPAGDKRILEIHQPVGVSVLVTPWNFPVAMATRKIGPALAAGCTVILKPASDTPLSALAIGAIMTEAGAPPGVVNTIPSRRSGEVVSAMLKDPRVRKLSFTGSTEVGRILLAEAAENIVNASMELGGNAPFVVLDDADLDAAVEGAMLAKMRNCGQACTSANRFYVHSSVAGEFASRFGKALESMRVGPGLEAGVDVGPLINAPARDSMGELVAAGLVEGAKVVVGGDAPSGAGYFYNPTLLTSVAPDASILDTEIFGPIAPVVEFDDPVDAVAMANATHLGLISYVYTSDVGRGLRIAEQLEAGMVAINKGLISDPAAAFGGVKQSGLGREGGHEGLLEFLETKYIGVSW